MKATVQSSKLQLKIQILTALILMLGASGCTTPVAQEATCEKADWYELGRRDGSQGSPTDRITKHRKNCIRTASEWETIYTNGRNAGLVEYCDPKNAFELGRMGVAYYYVCPSTVEPQFLTEYRRGQSARELVLQNQKLEQQIETLSLRLRQSGNRAEQLELNDEIEQLKKRRAKNERESLTTAK